MSAQRDPELDELFQSEPDLHELAQLLRSTPHPAAHVEPSPQFRVALRRRLMREAWEQASRPRVPWYQRLFAPRPLAALGAATGALLIAVTILSLVTAPQGPHTPPTVISPQDQSKAVSQVTPIQLDFSQPMDTRSVQAAVSIKPSTEVRYSWQNNGTRLTITPVNSLAPDTQYQVTVGQAAQTTSHQSLAHPAVVSFVTVAPTPTPTPRPSVQPTTTPPSSLIGVRQLAPVGIPAIVRWAPDGSHVFVVGPGGQLQSWPLQGAASPIAPEGVTAVAVGPDGTAAYVHDGQITYGSLAVTGVTAIALGFRQSSLVFATASDVETSDQQRLASLSETATAADFAPSGDRLAYRGASGLHVVDLTTHKDTLIPGPATALGDWLPDGHHYAYPTDGGVWVTDGTTTTKLVDDPGVTGLSWSHGNQVLLTTGTAIQLMNGDGAQLQTLQSGNYAQPLWAPGGSGTLSFRSGAQVWIAKVPSSLLATPTAAPALSQDELVSAFMAARKAQFPDPASFLDEAGKEAFAKITLVYTDPSLSLARSYLLLSQPGRIVVRLVLSRGSIQQALDETLIVQKDANGRPWIHGVTEVPRTSFSAGPEVLRVVVTGSQVQVQFDSDLVPGTVPTGVTVKQGGVSVPTQPATYDQTQRLVTLTVPGGLNPGATYELVLNGSLQDVGQRTAIPYELQFVGPQPASTS